MYIPGPFLIYVDTHGDKQKSKQGNMCICVGRAGCVYTYTVLVHGTGGAHKTKYPPIT